EPLRPLGRARAVERHVGGRDTALGASDALLHGALADEKGAGDLLYREAAYDAQREGDLLRRWQLGMAADEEEAQHVVSIVLVVESLGHLGFGVVQIRKHLVGRQRLLFAAAPLRVDGDVAPYENEPGCGVAWRPVLGPLLEGAQTCFLKGLLG